MKIGLMTEDQTKGNAIQRMNDFAIVTASSVPLPNPPPQAGEGTGLLPGEGSLSSSRAMVAQLT